MSRKERVRKHGKRKKAPIDRFHDKSWVAKTRSAFVIVSAFYGAGPTITGRLIYGGIALIDEIRQ